MVVFDFWILALLGLFALAGYFSGAVRQISHGVGLAAAFLGAKPAAALLGPSVAARMGWPLPLTTAGLNAVMMFAILVIAGQAARLVLNALEPGEERGPLDQGIGLVVGAVKGGAIIFTLLCAAVSFEKPLARVHFDLESKTRGSSFMVLAREHNFFASGKLPVPEGIKLTRARP